MFEEKRIKTLESRNKTLMEDNQKLHKRVVELETQLKSMEDLIKAAENYTEEHRIALRTVAEARDKYEIATKKMLLVKKEYEKKMNELIKALKE